jgi:DNA-binding NarL/FixJ family response regulator
MYPTEHAIRMARVLLADDHECVRKSLAAYFSSQGFSVVAEAGCGEEAVQQALVHQPDCVILDLRMPGTDGFYAIEQLAQRLPTTCIFVLSSLDDYCTRQRALQMGAHGYFVKGCSLKDMISAVSARLGQP